MVRGGGTKSPNHASPYGKGRWCEAPEGIRNLKKETGREEMTAFFGQVRIGRKVKR